MNTKAAIELYQLPASLNIKRATVLYFESLLGRPNTPHAHRVFLRSEADRLIQEIAIERKQLGCYKQIISTRA